MAGALVLCYHAVSPTWTAPLSVTPDALERQLRWLTARGWRAATFREAMSGAQKPRTLVLTFDDAFASVATLAHPILSSLGLVATVFVPTDYVSEGRDLKWSGTAHWAGTEHAPELAAMTWENLGALADQGWEIGSHTRTHPRLTELADSDLGEELEGSRAACVTQLGQPCETIAYPYGDVDERVAEAARAAGYVAGAALSRRLERLGPYRWPRTGIYHDDSWWRFRLKMSPSIGRIRRSSLWPREDPGSP